MKITIICDSGCDMTQHEAERQNVVLLPLKTMIDGREYLDGVNITGQEFYKRLENCRTLPTTSQISPAEFSAAYEQATQEGGQAVVITISSKLSGTAQSACIAAQDFPGSVWVVDSKSVTVGERVLLDYAIRLRQQGLTAADMTRTLESVKERVCVLARVDTLEYLMRGGRLSRTAAIAGTVLNIKPVLGVADGNAVVLGKARGAKQSDNLLSQFIAKKGGVDFSMPYMLAYSGADDSLLRGYIESSRSIWADSAQTLPISIIGSTIGTHAGPGAIAVAFFAPHSEKNG